MKEKIKKNVFVLGFASLLTDISSEMIFAILPVFMSSVLLLDKTAIGLIEGLGESSASMSKLVSARVQKIFGSKKRLVIFGYSLSTIVKPLFAFASTWWQILFIRAFDRAGKGLRGPPRDAIIADSTDQKTQGFYFGFHRTMDSIGAVIGPLIAFFLLSIFEKNFNIIFLFSFIPAFFAVLLIFFFVKEEQKSLHAKEEKKEFDKNKYNWFLLCSIIFAIGNRSVSFLLIRIQELGLSIALVPLAYLLFNASYALFSIPFGKLSDKIGPKKALSIAFLTFSVSFAGFSLVENTALAILLLSLHGFAVAGIETTQRVIAAQTVSQEKRTSGFGTYQGITGILLLPASLTTGALWSIFGAPAAFAFSALTSITAAILISRLK